ncbi:MAG: response regulator [Pseudomonadota bacterium]
MKKDKLKGLPILYRLLIAFFGAFVLYSLLLTVIFYSFSKDALEKNTKERLSQQIQEIAHHFHYDMKVLERELRSLASNPILNEYMMSSELAIDIHARGVERLFLGTFPYSKITQRICFVDAAGKEKIHVNRGGRVRKYRDLSRSPLFMQIEGGLPGGVHIQGPYRGKDGKFFFSMGVYKRDEDIGEFGGALIAEYSFDDFLDYVSHFTVFGENLIWLFTPEGEILKKPENPAAHFIGSEALPKSFQGIPLVKELQEGMLAYQDLAVIPDRPMLKVAISLPADLFLRDIKSILKLFSIVFLISIGGIFLIAYSLSKYLSKPVVELAEAASRLADGDLSTQVKIETTGEVQMLVNSFNRMAEDLQRKTVSKAYVDNIIGSMIETLIVISPDKKIMRFNAAACRLLGYEERELIGQPLGLIMEEGAADGGSGIDVILERGFVSNIEKTYLTKEGGKIPVLFSAASMLDDHQTLQGMVCVAQDIRSRKKAEKEKKNLEARLQRAQKMEALGTLAGGVAHDLNNILSGIVSYPELLLMDIPEESPLRKPLQTIKKSGERAATIVQDLLTLARRGVSVNEVVNLNRLVSEYLKSPEHRNLMSFHPAVIIETRLDPELLNIQGSAVHLGKTVMNLASNAAEAMKEGGTIAITTENRYVDKPIKGYDEVEEGNYATLIVSDSGSGIAPEDLLRIFEPFYTKKIMGRSGTGLGMAVIWGTVKDHRGYLDVRSVEGEGTRFTLYFPVTRESLGMAQSMVSLEDYRGRGESILIVDDVEEQRQIASEMLEKLGYTVAAVSSGEEAVEYIQKDSAHLIVLDMIMDPGIDGLETYRRIVKLKPGQKAVIASGFSETDRVREVQSLGAGMYIKKPYTIEKIGLAIRKELDRA